MKLLIVTVVLDGDPYIRHHLAQFEKLTCDWHWVICEGVAKNINCTSWCKEIPPRLSNDGTTEYLASIANNKRVTVVQKPLWRGKIEMFNCAVGHFNEPGILLQVDSDELWTAEQLTRLMRLYRERPSAHKMYFFCRYFVGPKIITVGQDGYGNRKTEFLRSWRFHPGMIFQKHEPPIFNHNTGLAVGRHETKAHGLVFDHMAYALEKQVAFKETYYGYTDAVKHWRRLQANTEWPVRNLSDFLPWVGDKVGANIL